MGAYLIKVDSRERAYDMPAYEDTASLNCVLFFQLIRTFQTIIFIPRYEIIKTT